MPRWYASVSRCIETTQPPNIPTVDHWRQGVRERDTRAFGRRCLHLGHRFLRTTYPHRPLLVAVGQELLDHYLTESLCDWGTRYVLVRMTAS